MSNTQWEEEVIDYIAKSSFAILAYVREDKTPILRSMGSFATSGLDLYFTSRKDSVKVKEIEINQQVSFFFEHDNQSLPSWKSVLLSGKVELIEKEPEFSKGVELLCNKNPRFKERVAKGELETSGIFKIKTREIEYLDYSKGFGFVQKFKL